MAFNFETLIAAHSSAVDDDADPFGGLDDALLNIDMTQFSSRSSTARAGGDGSDDDGAEPPPAKRRHRSSGSPWTGSPEASW